MEDLGFSMPLRGSEKPPLRGVFPEDEQSVKRMLSKTFNSLYILASKYK
jgi:hypothetical protein